MKGDASFWRGNIFPLVGVNYPERPLKAGVGLGAGLGAAPPGPFGAQRSERFPGSVV